MNPPSYLLGDILSVGRGEPAAIRVGAAPVPARLAWRWLAPLTATLDRDLARAGGVGPERERLILVLALAVVVAVTLQVVGALLIAALMIVPAAVARPPARSPEAMVLVAMALGAASALGGLRAAFVLDAPAGPSIVCVAAILFAATGSVDRLRGRLAAWRGGGVVAVG